MCPPRLSLKVARIVLESWYDTFDGVSSTDPSTIETVVLVVKSDPVISTVNGPEIPAEVGLTELAARRRAVEP